MKEQKNFLSIKIDSEKSRLLIFLGAFIVNISLFLGFENFILQDISLLNFDAELYFSISERGYDHEFLNAFFPAFPYLWGLTALSPLLISIFNLFLAYSSIFVLSKMYQWSRFQVFMALFIPSSIIYFLPYSEALFAVFCLIILMGYKYDSIWLLILGFFFANTCRPAATIFVPALILVELFYKRDFVSKMKRLVLFIIANLLGLLTVFVVQLSYGWPFFTAFKVQSYWGNKLQFPLFPLRSWGGNWSTRLDGIALFFAIILLVWLFQKFIKKEIHNIEQSKLFSIFYVIGISMSVLIFRGGSLFSLNRFVFATLFGVVVLNELLQKQMSLVNRGYLFLVVSIFFFLFKSFNHIMNLLNFEFIALLFVMLFGANLNLKFERYLRPILIFVIGLIYVFTCHHIWTGGWIA